ncbi:hypothetical protein R5R35_003241 [Gryllus longicercus]|uniref:Uncharacterized protein n=1 Tax=Gryllus longicercus TaxID=2509291 RepID=A0AAN9VU06_9ORTH
MSYLKSTAQLISTAFFVEIGFVPRNAIHSAAPRASVGVACAHWLTPIRPVAPLAAARGEQAVTGRAFSAGPTASRAIWCGRSRRRRHRHRHRQRSPRRPPSTRSARCCFVLDLPRFPVGRRRNPLGGQPSRHPLSFPLASSALAPLRGLKTRPRPMARGAEGGAAAALA